MNLHKYYPEVTTKALIFLVPVVGLRRLLADHSDSRERWRAAGVKGKVASTGGGITTHWSSLPHSRVSVEVSASFPPPGIPVIMLTISWDIMK